MTLEEIKTALENGEKVCWANTAYDVIKDSIGQYLIVCNLNQHTIGLTWQDGITMNGEEKQFFIKPDVNPKIYSMQDIRDAI